MQLFIEGPDQDRLRPIQEPREQRATVADAPAAPPTDTEAATG